MTSNLANEPARVVGMFRKMLLIRAFEEAAGEAFHLSLIHISEPTRPY